MKVFFVSSFLAISVYLFGAIEVKLGEVCSFVKARENQLVGYGLVVGIKGRGDSKNSGITKDTIGMMLRRLNIPAINTNFMPKNSAFVIVSANIPAFSDEGDKIDVSISSLFDAATIYGGYLVQTPLYANDGKIYAVAQGSIECKKGERSGRITKGAIVEKRIEDRIFEGDKIRLTLNNPSLQSIIAINRAIKEAMPELNTKIINDREIVIDIENKDGFDVINKLKDISVRLPYSNKVVIDKESGVIVMGGNVRISKSAISYKGMQIKIGRGKKSISSAIINDTTDVETLVATLNKIGIKTKDIINIIVALDKAGALQGKLILK